MKTDQRGLTPLLLLILVIPILILVAAVAWKNTQNQGSGLPFRQDEHGQDKNRQPPGQVEWPLLWGGGGQNCQDKKSVQLTTSPVAIDNITFIEPMGELKQGHVAPGDHIGINYETSPGSKPVDVFAPADATIAMVEHHPYTPPAGYREPLYNYHMYLVHSCTFFTGFVHVTDLAPELLAKSKELEKLHAQNPQQPKNIWPNIEVKAGEKIGTAWSFGLLGMVTVDLTKTNTGYLKPESYKSENWRIHGVAPWEYFVEPLKTKWYDKNPRTAEPRGGKIDFDIEGKLVGNWFEKGTGGFRDEKAAPKQCGNFPCPYWDGHIAFVYDYIDPAQLRVSVGHDWGLDAQTPYGVKSNALDFKDIGVKDGLIKYELVALKDLSAERGYITEDPLIEVSDETRPLGTILVQITDKDALKAEVFPGKNPSQIAGFTSKARTYER